MITKEAANKILEQFESIQKRPAMYFGSDEDIVATENFFRGYNVAAFALIGRPFSIAEFYRAATESRGWELRACTVTREMLEKGYSSKDIVAELIAVELDSWRAYLEQF